MRVVSSTERGSLPDRSADCLPVVLYARADRKEAASAGAAVADDLEPVPKPGFWLRIMV